VVLEGEPGVGVVDHLVAGGTGNAGGGEELGVLRHVEGRRLFHVGLQLARAHQPLELGARVGQARRPGHLRPTLRVVPVCAVCAVVRVRVRAV
jgi:hypothetical protein